MTEPYRYACPECDSVDLKVRTREGGYRCNYCLEVFTRPVDKKLGRRVSV